MSTHRCTYQNPLHDKYLSPRCSGTRLPLSGSFRMKGYDPRDISLCIKLSVPNCLKCSKIYIQGVYKLMVQFQKLTRNLFLTVHWHNVHRQQRQLSKFLMRYQQFDSHAYCGAAGPFSNMASQQEKAFCVLRSEVSGSVITVQREFCAWFRL